MKDYSTKVRLTIDFDVDVRAEDEDSACEKAYNNVEDFWHTQIRNEAEYILECKLNDIEILDIKELGPDVMKASHQNKEDSQ